MAVRGSLGRRSSLENPIRASNASRAGSNPNTQANTPRESQPDRIVVRVVQVVEVDEKDKDNSRGAGQDGSEPATSNTDGTSQHQPKVRRDPTARTRHLRLRQRLLGHPGRYNLPRGVADRGDHRVGHHHVPGGCPTIGAPHREHTRAVTATSAAHSRHLICTHPTADAECDTTHGKSCHGSSRQAHRTGPRHHRDRPPSPTHSNGGKAHQVPFAPGAQVLLTWSATQASCGGRVL